MQPPRPSLNALRAFEAVARLRSMTAAADELSVTHGAVSRHVRALEESLGVALLTRGPRSMDPTAEGARLAEGLAAAFRQIDSSIAQLKPGPLTLSCSTSIMMYWLMPRISRFHERYPDVDLQFNMNFGRIDVARDNIAVAIRNSMIEPPLDVVVRELAGVHASCALALLRRSGGSPAAGAEDKTEGVGGVGKGVLLRRRRSAGARSLRPLLSDDPGGDLRPRHRPGAAHAGARRPAFRETRGAVRFCARPA